MANTCHLPIKIDPETGEEYVTTYDKNDLLSDIASEIGPEEENKDIAVQRKMLQLHSLIGTGEPIRDRSIIEMRYEPKNESGWRWIPIRVRHDKTERLIKGAKTGNYARTLNSEKVANSVWNSIHNPVTTTMIRTGSEEPTEQEIKDLLKARDTDVAKKYYERKASEEDIMLVRGMLDFHNKYIKNTLLYMKLLKGGGKSVLDIGCGKGGDLYKWIFNRARLVVGIDVAGENITNPRDGAYKRYLEAIVEFGYNRVPQVAFVIGNFSRSVINGDAGATPEERDMLRSIFGKEEPEGPVPKYIETKMAGSLRAGADMAVSMFTVHYFFENKESLDGLIKNLNDTVKVGGYFAGAAFDGQKVFNMLRGVEKGHSKSGKEGDVPIWSITKQYDNVELTPDDSSIGMAVDVEFISIGTTHREYLVPFELLQLKLKEIGFEVLDADESKQLGLNNGTNTFDISYQMAEKAGKKFVMPDSVKEFSFLNRWFIFKRKSEKAVLELPPAAIEEVEGEEGEEATAVVASSVANGESAVKVTKLDTSSGVEERKEGEGEDEGEEEEEAAEPNTGYKMPAADRKFAPAEIFRFGSKVPPADSLKIKDANAPLWLALNAPFPIPDPDDATVTYPTIEHYLAGMKLKLASNKPILAKQLMSTAGSIHQAALIKRRTKGGIALDSPYDIELRGEESNEVKKGMLKKSLNSLRAVFDETAWIPIKDNALRNALEYRWENDKRFHGIVEAARNQGKYLLYSSDSPGSELGGVRSPATGRIDGENKVGIFIMQLAGFKF
jgi:SAM-dependent methyltransferase